MPRTALLALAVAAVLGTTAGAMLAAHQDRPTDHPRSAAAPDLPATNEPLLYASSHRIVDGTHVIDYQGPDNVDKIVRIRGGYLIADRRTSEKPDFDLWSVTTSGTTERVASVTGSWDVDATGTRLTSFDTATGVTKVWSLPDGEVTARWNHDNGNPTVDAFSGRDVIVSQRDGDTFALLRWDPATGTTDPAGQGYAQARVSPKGTYVTGSVNETGSSARPIGRCLQARTIDPSAPDPVSWQSCRWVGYLERPLFSPDGRRLLVVPAGTAAHEVRALGVIDVAAGPRPLVGRFDVPAGTLRGMWADNDHLFLVGTNTGDSNGAVSGTWVDRCDLTGACKRLVTLTQLVTLASTS